MYPTKVSIANNKGFESITAISRAFEVGTPAEDVVLSKYTLFDCFRDAGNSGVLPGSRFFIFFILLYAEKQRNFQS